MASLLAAQYQEMNTLDDEHKKTLSKLQETQAQRVVTTKAALDRAFGKVPEGNTTSSAIKVEDWEDLGTSHSARTSPASATTIKLRAVGKQDQYRVDHPEVGR